MLLCTKHLLALALSGIGRVMDQRIIFYPESFVTWGNRAAVYLPH